MRISLKLLLITIVVMSSCQNNTVLTFNNPLDIQRENEIITFTFDELENLIGPFREGKRPLFVSGADTLVTQFIDYQGNDLPEEILIEMSIPSNESREVTVEWLDGENYPNFPSETNIHFARHQNPGEDLDSAVRLQTVKTEETSSVFQMEGPAWENDKVGFRNYFDLRNGMDIFGKRTSEMVLSSVGLKEEAASSERFDFTKSYHELSDWGMDILKVGNSLGAGAVALEIGDSLYRLGDNGYGAYEKLYEGPLKSEFRFSFPDWEAGGKIRNIIQYISITAGKYCYKSSLFLKENADNASFVTGIVNKQAEELISFDAGNEHIAFLTHSRQAEDGNFLGMAILVKKEDLVSSGKTRDKGEGITETYFVKLNTEKGKEAIYRFYGFWETSNPDFKDIENLKSIIDRDALKIENPIKVDR